MIEKSSILRSKKGPKRDPFERNQTDRDPPGDHLGPKVVLKDDFGPPEAPKVIKMDPKVVKMDLKTTKNVTQSAISFQGRRHARSALDISSFQPGLASHPGSHFIQELYVPPLLPPSHQEPDSQKGWILKDTRRAGDHYWNHPIITATKSLCYS